MEYLSCRIAWSNQLIWHTDSPRSKHILHTSGKSYQFWSSDRKKKHILIAPLIRGISLHIPITPPILRFLFAIKLYSIQSFLFYLDSICVSNVKQTLFCLWTFCCFLCNAIKGFFFFSWKKNVCWKVETKTSFDKHMHSLRKMVKLFVEVAIILTRFFCL